MNQFERMLKGYKKYPWIFEGEHVEEQLTILTKALKDWEENDKEGMQFQFDVNKYSLPVWNGLAFYISNISVCQTYDLSHVTLVYRDSFIARAEEYITTGRVYLTK